MKWADNRLEELKRNTHLIELTHPPVAIYERTVTDGAVQVQGALFYPRPDMVGIEYDGSLEGERKIFIASRVAGMPKHMPGHLICYDSTWSYWSTDEQHRLDQQFEERLNGIKEVS
jgi:hypothetical protein